MPRDIVVPPDCAPMRLDQFVAARVEGMSRRRVRQIDLLLNGRPAKHATTVHPGDVVSLPDDAETGTLQPNPALEISILYRDEALVAVDKPPGMQSVALDARETGTVANFLLARFPEVRDAGAALEGGLVHRLDEGTSGLLVAARSAAVYAELRRQFGAHEVEKEYLALVRGNIDTAGTVDVPIAHDPRREARMLACGDADAALRHRARPASTRYEPVLRYGFETLLRVRMRTGVRHQIRVHLAWIGHPIIGDRLYGGAPKHRWIHRQALHASRVRLRHPVSGEPLEIDCPLPRDLEEGLRRLKP